MNGPVYMHPASFRPPLAFGGHEWLWHEHVATCWGCGLTVPIWALVEGLWMTLGPRWCPNKIAALNAPKLRLRRHRPVPAQLDGQLSIFDVLGDPA